MNAVKSGPELAGRFVHAVAERTIGGSSNRPGHRVLVPGIGVRVLAPQSAGQQRAQFGVQQRIGECGRYVGATVQPAFGPQQPDLRLASNCALAFMACLAVGSTILHGVYLIVGRRRPRDDMEMGRYGFVWFEFKLDYNSFPSGHALTIMCVAVIATCVWPHLAIVWFAMAMWLGITRALLTAHFFSDVFIGAGIGLVAARETLLYLFASLAPAWY